MLLGLCHKVESLRGLLVGSKDIRGDLDGAEVNDVVCGSFFCTCISCSLVPIFFNFSLVPLPHPYYNAKRVHIYCRTILVYSYINISWLCAFTSFCFSCFSRSSNNFIELNHLYQICSLLNLQIGVQKWM